MIKHWAIAGAAGLTLVAQAVAAEGLGSIEVEAEPLPLLGGNRTIPEAGRGIAADGGELLRSVPGVSGTRLGGKGVDPVIRGQSQNRLNILIDGAYVYGGCPNRMDPPASFANIESYDQVTVLKGVQTLKYGGGGSGGTVLFERGRYRFDDQDFHGKVSGSYAGNGSRSAGMADFAVGTEQGYARMIGARGQAKNYQDGDGKEVRTGYQDAGATLSLGWTPDRDTLAELTLEATRSDDVLYAGGMDAPVDDNDTVRLQFERGLAVGPFSAVKAELYQTDVHHVMDNFTLRTLTAPMRMSVDSNSVTRGLRLQGELEGLGGHWNVGLDHQGSDRDAVRTAGAALATQSFMWPDVTIDQTGLFAEGEWEVGEAGLLKGGLRYDRIDSSAAKAATATAMTVAGINTANGLYQRYYGTTASDHDDNAWGALLRYEREIGNATWFAGFSRSVRAADVTERYMAANAGPTGVNFPSRWVGNPNLEAETHHQLETGAAWSGAGWNLGGVVYYNRVSDYILRDRARGQSGILVADLATIYRNVDAKLYGFELDGGWKLAERWTVSGNLAYVRAENTSDSRDIGQTPPLELTASLDYDTGVWSAGATLRAAAKQTHVEDDMLTGSAIDAGQTDGWGVLDLHGSYRITKDATLDAGIDNLFDKTYANHLNQANAFDPATVQINEPGRNAWAKVNVRW